MMYKTELHLHSAEVSRCATVKSEEIVDAYTAEGYSTVVLTNHMSRFTYENKDPDHSELTWQEKCDHYMAGFHALREAAGDRLHVLLGMELRSNVMDCDYLIYGMTEEFMRAIPEMMDIPLKQLVPKLRAAGMLIYQAHPFRNDIRITNPDLLDGLETYNANTVPFRNEIAGLWAKNYGLREISGSDYHHTRHLIYGGIVTDSPITSNEQLIKILRSSSFIPIRGGMIAE